MVLETRQVNGGTVMVVALRASKSRRLPLTHRCLLPLLPVAIWASSAESVWSQAAAPQTAPPAAQQPVRDVAAGPAPLQPDQQMPTLAIVNGEPITRQQLASESMKRFGEEVLESLVSKHLVFMECQNRGILITEKDVNDDIIAKAKALGMSAEYWMKMICEQRKITEDRVKNDIIWMQMALRRLAEKEIQVSNEDIQKRMELEYGPKVRVREIVLTDRSEAEKIRAEAMARPADFGNLAKQYSKNPVSQALKGLIPPIALHTTEPAFEQVIFAMKPGDISEVLTYAENQFVVLKCEELFPAVQLPPDQIAAIEERLVKEISDAKLTDAAASLFKRLQEATKVVNVVNDPELSQKYPGVAAMVGDQVQIRTLDLAEECIVRYGQDILQAEIDRTLLLQALKAANKQVSQDDINNEIRRAAESFGYRKTDGSIDLQAWLTFVTDGNLKKVDFYVSDVVWKSVALKKLVESRVEVTTEDLQKGFEANFGQKVECLAIMLRDQRTALKVWQMASANPTEEYFGQLAKQYSVEPASQNNNGQVPPIRRHSGRPDLEEEAFSLKSGEISKVVQVGEYYIILFCQGMTEPVVTEFDAVKEHLYQDILEKKLRLAMEDEFLAIRGDAQIDNFLAGTSQSGKALRAAAKQNEQRGTQR